MPDVSYMCIFCFQHGRAERRDSPCSQLLLSPFGAHLIRSPLWFRSDFGVGSHSGIEQGHFFSKHLALSGPGNRKPTDRRYSSTKQVSQAGPEQGLVNIVSRMAACNIQDPPSMTRR